MPSYFVGKIIYFLKSHNWQLLVTNRWQINSQLLLHQMTSPVPDCSAHILHELASYLYSWRNWQCIVCLCLFSIILRQPLCFQSMDTDALTLSVLRFPAWCFKQKNCIVPDDLGWKTMLNRIRKEANYILYMNVKTLLLHVLLVHTVDNFTDSQAA